MSEYSQIGDTCAATARLTCPRYIWSDYRSPLQARFFSVGNASQIVSYHWAPSSALQSTIQTHHYRPSSQQPCQTDLTWIHSTYIYTEANWGETDCPRSLCNHLGRKRDMCAPPLGYQILEAMVPKELEFPKNHMLYREKRKHRYLPEEEIVSQEEISYSSHN